MTKVYTINEVIALQNEKQQLEQRLAIHKKRAEEKREELQKLLATEGVSSFEELQQLCEKLNTQMQNYAIEEESTIQQMREMCNELDRIC